jgi:deoxyribonuclease V
MSRTITLSMCRSGGFSLLTSAVCQKAGAKMRSPVLAGHPGGVKLDDGRPGVFAAADVHYLPSGGARAAAVIAADAMFSVVLAEQTVLIRQVLPYRPGEFFLRELPPLRALLAGVAGLGLLVVDGYADLDPAGRPGLGAHAHAALGVPVIGVAKTRFRTATHAVEIRRGKSARPLFVTAAGMPPAQAASLVREMAGPFRIPDALRRADALARTGASAADQPAWSDSSPAQRRAQPSRDSSAGPSAAPSSVSR